MEGLVKILEIFVSETVVTLDL